MHYIIKKAYTDVANGCTGPLGCRHRPEGPVRRPTDDPLECVGPIDLLQVEEGSNAVLPSNVLERISRILGVYKALQILLSDERAADEWVRRPNAVPLFGGQSVLERMLSGQVADLFVVRQYLDAQRGGWA